MAIERWQRQQARLGNPPTDEVPFALMHDGPHGPVVTACNRAAHLAGLTTGARVVDMRALCPGLQVEYADLAGDRAALHRLMLWARRWCPWTAVDGTDLVLDTTGADHLWGGEAAMLEDMETRLSHLGLSCQLAVAPTWGAAWAQARYGPVRGVHTDLSALAALPVAALRLAPDTVLLLHRLGLKTIGALQQVPRLSLMRRFARAAPAENPLLRLDQAMGQLAEPISSTPEAPPLRCHSALAEPVRDAAPHLPALCETLCQQMQDQGVGCRRLRLSVYRTDGEMRQIEVATAAPNRDPHHLHTLFGDRLERIDPGFGFDLIQLEATVTEPLATQQATLSGRTADPVALSQLTDRLAARFGAGKVARTCWQASHIPERAQIRGAATAPAQPPTAPRPVYLLTPPEEIGITATPLHAPPAQFIWRKQTHQITRSQGPERIAPEWWQDKPGTQLRDYFRIEDDRGRRLWIYREGATPRARWFLHGWFP